MDEYNYSAGPWKVIANSWQFTTVYDDDSGDPICRLDLEDWGVTEENQDNLEAEQSRVARLIGAVPDMRKALIEAERFMAYFADETGGHFVGPGTPAGCLAQIRAAIAKATA